MKQKQEQTITNIEEIYAQKHSSSPQNKQKNIKKKWGFLVSVFSSAILASGYFISPYSTIGSIEVTGTNEVLDQEVIDYSGVLSGNSLWGTYFENESIEQSIKEQLPQVKEAEISIEGLNNVAFRIIEYKTTAFLSKDGTYFKVLENGVILEEGYPDTFGELPIFINFSDNEVLDQMLTEYDELDDSVKVMISEIEWIESERNPLLIKSYMNNGNEVIASIPSFAERMRHYPQLIEAVEGENGLFDLEAGAYFLPFSSNEDQEYDEKSKVDLEG